MHESGLTVESAATSSDGVEALYLRRGDRAALFALHHLPMGAEARGLVVYIHPLAEEMNKTRRMAALQSRALARAGFAVFQVDLSGCGDSAEEFGDATWQAWVLDVVASCRWLQARHAIQHGGAPGLPLWLWGLRSGCLLAAQAAERLDGNCHFLFWQPVLQGDLMLTQFLRLASAANMLATANGPKTSEIKHALQAGRPAFVAGYQISAELANGLAAMKMPAAPARGRAVWLETSNAPGAALSPGVERAVTAWRAAGGTVTARVVAGPQFWQTVEIELAPALIDASTSALLASLDDRSPLSSTST